MFIWIGDCNQSVTDIFVINENIEPPVPIRVAIVEDDEEIRANLTHRIKGGAAFRLLCSCADAESALAELPAHQPDVVLMDINLPNMNGVECVRILKTEIPDTQFIMLT